MSRVIYGALAGICATMAMTAAMRALHSQLDREDRYPLPPREITQGTLPVRGEAAAASTMLAHFGFGAAAGAVYGVLPKGIPGLVYGPLVWFASYLGWVPAARILIPATRHPPERNLLMIAVHLVWGACLSLGVRELEASARSIFASGSLDDRVQGDDVTGGLLRGSH